MRLHSRLICLYKLVNIHVTRFPLSSIQNDFSLAFSAGFPHISTYELRPTDSLTYSRSSSEPMDNYQGSTLNSRCHSFPNLSHSVVTITLLFIAIWPMQVKVSFNNNQINFHTKCNLSQNYHLCIISYKVAQLVRIALLYH